jgi:hypothetical protein
MPTAFRNGGGTDEMWRSPMRLGWYLWQSSGHARSAAGQAQRHDANGTRNPRNGQAPTYTRNAAKVRANANLSYLCGKPFTADDPAVADHVQPRAYGGSDDISNLKAAHKSCNGRKGANLPSWTCRAVRACRIQKTGLRHRGEQPTVRGATCSLRKPKLHPRRWPTRIGYLVKPASDSCRIL